MTDATTGDLVAWIERFQQLVLENQSELTRLDSEIGDADHGSNMARGMSAAAAKLAENPPATLRKL